MLVSKGKESTPTAINVMPEVIFLANSRYATVVIVAAHDGGTSHGVDKEWLVSLGNLSLDHFFESLDTHSTSESIARNSSHLVHSHSTDHSASGNGIVGLDWGEADWLVLW